MKPCTPNRPKPPVRATRSETSLLFRPNYAADVPHLSQRAHLRVQLEEDTRVLTWGELQTMFQWMSRSRWLIAGLTQAAMEKDVTASEKSLLGWQGFPEHG